MIVNEGIPSAILFWYWRPEYGADALFGRDRRLAAVVAAEVENRQRFGPADDASARNPTTRTDNTGWSFSHG
jgi:hypothetical protein